MSIQIISTGSVPNNAAGSQFGLVINQDGSLNTFDFTTNYIQKMAYDSNGLIEYLGLATPGANVGSAVWQIRKLTYSGANNVNTDVQFASGVNAFQFVWNDRASYTFS